ncbi:hypothetical protein JTE90_028704 [Oedothorax gibbosus]|uniref:Uncharacterized protein n=1 Tax=Oedothorax gibbosus TaxID=931172 RepID=A0AAV6U2E4_9ARAC|nr:hypothetical protein JTE90_028704 [Oedothorax gibbosus]
MGCKVAERIQLAKFQSSLLHNELFREESKPVEARLPRCENYGDGYPFRKFAGKTKALVVDNLELPKIRFIGNEEDLTPLLERASYRAVDDILIKNLDLAPPKVEAFARTALSFLRHFFWRLEK